MIVEPLCFRIADELPVRDGEGCFLERVSGRESEMAVGEHFLWSAGERTLDLVTAPRGGFGALTAAVERAAPRLGDASAGRRRGLGGAVSHAIYDAGLVLALAGIFLLWATGRTEVVAGVAQRVLAWGGSVGA